MAEEMKIAELNRLYSEAETIDQDIFAEQRSNILLVAGEHYTRKYSKYYHRIRDNRDLTDQQKLRLTKNHTQAISKRYKNSIYTYSPDVTIVAENETELQDQKSAELRLAVWQCAKNKYKLPRKFRDWISDFVDIGEVAVKIFYDPNQGALEGYEQEVNDDGEPQVDETGQPKASDKAVYKGDYVFERVFGFNLLRDQNAKSMDESPWLIIRKMVDIKVLKKMVGEDESKTKFIDGGKDETYLIFDNTSMGYRSVKDQTTLKEMYIRPGQTVNGINYPNGHFFFFVNGGILFEGDLPFGIFPIIYKAFDEVPTHPRGRSIIKQLRPYQAEINRAASKIGEHQITLGDDKLLVQGGTTLAQGGLLPGVRGITYTGAVPVILGGRDGSQYLAYMQNQIEEMYRVAMIDENTQETQQQIEPYSMLFQSLKQKKVFTLYSSKFEEFLTDVCRTYLDLHKNYVKDDELIMQIGRREQVNIAEYRQSSDLGYQIQIVPQVEDIETKMGKHLTFTTILQYAGGQLKPEDIGKLIKNMPYGNLDESFNDLTVDYENAKNDILALDRGEVPTVGAYENHPYIIQRLTNRMKQADFKFLSPQIQQNYENLKFQHEQIETQNQQQIAAAKSEYIPTGGYLVGVDFYVSDPSNPNKTRRARIPSQSVEWIISKLEAQGMGLEKLSNIDTASKAQMAAQMMGNQQKAMQQPMDQGQGAQQGGSSQGVSQNGNNASSGNTGLNGFESGANSSIGQYGLK